MCKTNNMGYSGLSWKVKAAMNVAIEVLRKVMYFAFEPFKTFEQVFIGIADVLLAYFCLSFLQTSHSLWQCCRLAIHVSCHFV